MPGFTQHGSMVFLVNCFLFFFLQCFQCGVFILKYLSFFFFPFLYLWIGWVTGTVLSNYWIMMAKRSCIRIDMGNA
jgi:hypothetical protein